MIVVTTENIANHRVRETLGQCFGVVVRSRGLGGNVMAGLRSIVGGEIVEYTKMLEDARRHAIDRLVANANVMGANAVMPDPMARSWKSGTIRQPANAAIFRYNSAKSHVRKHAPFWKKAPQKLSKL